MSNQHVSEYLEEYVGLTKAPKFAVLITGAWGAGKTHAVKNFLKALVKKKKKTIYVSLFGVKDAEDLDVALLSALVKGGESALVKLGTRVGRAFLKKASFGAKLEVKDLLTKSKVDLYVFDDLERCQMPVQEVLGYINVLIEHDEMKVALICNEDRLKSNKTYIEFKEKIVGASLSFKPQVREVIEFFIDDIEDKETKDFLIENKDDAVLIFQQSETENLRVLDQSLKVWARLYKHFDASLRSRKEAIQKAFAVFLALSIEVRQGRIRREDLTDRSRRIAEGNVSKENKDKVVPIHAAQQRYSEIYLRSDVFSDEVLQEVLCDHRFDKDKIMSSLNASKDLKSADKLPSWHRIWHHQTANHEEFSAAVLKMEEDLSHYVFTKSGDVLHVFGLRLFLSKIQHWELKESDVIESCKQYVDKLFELKLLSSGYDDPLFEGGLTGAYGLGFSTSGTQAFKELAKYYRTRCLEALEQSWPEAAAKLIETMKSSPREFFASVCYTNDDRKNEYARVPVFSNADVGEFVERLLDCDADGQRIIFRALEGRYEFGRLEQDLASERPWLERVRSELEEKSEKLAPVRRFWIKQYLRDVIDPALAPRN